MAPDGKVLIGGRFDQYDGVPRPGLARLTGPTVSLNAPERLPNASVVIRGSGAPRSTYKLEATNAMGSEPFAPMGTVQTDDQGSFNFTDSEAPLLPVRFYRLALP